MCRRACLLVVLFSLFAILAAQSSITAAQEVLTAHFINVGQGDSCWLRLPNGDDILVDGGKAQVAPTVVAHLQRNGVADIELMVATHGDSDHIGGLLGVLTAMPVRTAFLDSQDCTTQTCLDLYRSLAEHGVLTGTVRMGQSYNRGGVTVLVLNPSEPLSSEKNENSVVLRVSYGSVDFLLTGDAETGAERRMMASGLPLEAEILKVAHHGSNSSSSATFLGAVGPKEAIISVGPNPYGHPKAEVLQRLTDAGAKVWRTDQVGTIVVTTSGVTYTIEPASAGLSTWLYLPFVIRGMGVSQPTATATASPMASATLTETPRATETSTPTPTGTPTATQTPTPTPTTGPSTNELRITALQYSGRDEYVEIRNGGPGAQNMTGWRIQSVVGDQWYTFPTGYVLAAGSWVRVHSGPDAMNNPPSDLRWSTAYIWSNDGDEAKLYNASGQLVDRWAY